MDPVSQSSIHRPDTIDRQSENLSRTVEQFSRQSKASLAYGSKTVGELNRVSDRIFDGMMYVGEKFSDVSERLSSRPSSALFEGFKQLESEQSGALKLWNIKTALETKLPLDYLEKYARTKAGSNLMTKAGAGMGKVLSFADAISGVGSFLQTFAKERQAGSTLYPETMKDAATAVAKSATTTLIVGGTAAAIGGIASLPALPAVAAVVGIGAAAYGAGKAIDGFRTWLSS